MFLDACNLHVVKAVKYMTCLYIFPRKIISNLNSILELQEICNGVNISSSGLEEVGN
jgi:hypothetical protein